MKKNFKKLTALILMTVFVFSFGFMSVSAAKDYSGHWAEANIDFVIENGYWTAEGNFLPDQPITRAEFSALLVNSLKTAKVEIIPDFEDVDANTPYVYEIYSAYKMGLIKGDGRNFNPYNTITRQEVAAILDRASYIIDGDYNEAEVTKSRFTDFSSISDWAQQSVFNAVDDGLMQGVSAKKFNPLGTITRAECATIAKRISERTKLDKLDFTVRDAGLGEEKNFPIMNDAMTKGMRGVTGFAVLARFEEGGPKEIYFSRTTEENTVVDSGMAWDPTPIAKVLDPDGNLIAVYDFSHMKTGTEKKIISVNCDKPGVYTMQVMNGRNDDYFEIGIKDCESWGIRGEKILGRSKSMPKNGYIYTQRTNQYVYVGVSTATPINLLDLDGKVVGTSKAVSRPNSKHDLILENAVKPNTVYQLQFPDNFTGTVVTDGFPGLICPTAEMAEDLKGGWFDEDGAVTQGPLQMRARKKAVEIAKEGNFNVVINRPAQVPTDIQNPMAEAQLFGAYGVISGIGSAMSKQVLDPESPYLGYVANLNETTPAHNYQACLYGCHVNYRGMAAALSIPLELNYAYGNQALANRVALAMLYFVVEMGEDYEDRQNSLKTHNDPMVSMFDYDGFIEAYIECKNFFDAETRDILYEAVIAMGNKMLDYPGQGVTNQGLFHPLNNIRLYSMLGCDPKFEFLHNAYKRQIPMLMRTDVYGENIGYHESYGYVDGHFIENGFDGQYEYMDREEWVENYLEYKNCKNRDPKLFDAMTKLTEEMLDFELAFCAPQPQGTTFYLSNAWTSRTTGTFGGGNNPGFEKLFHIFPSAALRMNVLNTTSYTDSTVYPHKINNEEWAWNHINEFYPKYENYYDFNTSRTGREWPFSTFEAFNSDVKADYTGMELPVYQDDGIKLETSEVLALKHKGIYMLHVYQNADQIISTNSWKKPYSYVGGAPAFVWSENTGSVGLSMRKANSTVKFVASDEELYLSAVYGTLDGVFFHTGREGQVGYGNTEANKLTWIEPGKKYSISGRVPDTGAIITWTYELTDTGVDMTVTASGVKPSDELWLNLPINAQEKNATVKFDETTGKIDYLYADSGHMTYSWDNAYESLFLNADENSVGVHRLRIKMPEDGVKIHMEVVK